MTASLDEKRLAEREAVRDGFARVRSLLADGVRLDYVAAAIDALARRARRCGDDEAAALADRLIDTIRSSSAWRHVENARATDRVIDPITLCTGDDR